MFAHGADDAATTSRCADQHWHAASARLRLGRRPSVSSDERQTLACLGEGRACGHACFQRKSVSTLPLASASVASPTARSPDASLSTPSWLSSVVGAALNRPQTCFATHRQPFTQGMGAAPFPERGLRARAGPA
jgi:hypothetical protein